MLQLVASMAKNVLGKITACASSDESLMLAGVILVVSVCGAFGGIAGGLYRKKCGHKPSLVTWGDVLIFAASGIVCAYGIILFGTGITNMFSKVSNYEKAFYLIGLSIVSGFFAMRLIPKIGSKIEKRLESLDNKLDLVSKEGESMVVYQKLLSACQVALSTEEKADIDAAIELLRKDAGTYPKDRMLNVYFGRLLRRKGDLRGAITVLRAYVGRMLEGVNREMLSQVDKEAIAVAYYNIACYHSMLAGEMPHEKNRLLQEAKDALVASHCFDSGIADKWQADVDLKALKEVDKDFSPGT